jgi:capsule polysaccharide modification protein KpsS
VLRPHPLQGLDKEIKELHTQFPLQFQYAHGDCGLEENLIQSKGVVTVNSNGGLEALLYGKPVFILGRSYYEGCYGVVKTVEELLMFGNSKEMVVKSASKFIDDCFIPVDYRSGDMNGAQIIGKMLERQAL